MPDDRQLFALAARQHSLVSRGQARAIGFDRKALRRRVDAGTLALVTPDVIRVTASPVTPHQRLLAAVLDAGSTAVVSHQSAAALWELPGYALNPAHVTVRRGRDVHHESLGIVHTSTLLPEHHSTEIDGIPVTNPTRLAFDLSGRVHPAKLERTIETLWSRRLTSAPRLYRMLDELSEHGRPKIQAIREYLEPRGKDYRPMESGLELRVQQIVVQDGQPPLVPQVDTGDVDGWIGRVDFRDATLPFVVEVNSDLYHGSLLDRQRDADRVARLRAAGYVVVEISEFDAWHDPATVAASVRSGRALARQIARQVAR